MMVHHENHHCPFPTTSSAFPNVVLVPDHASGCGGGGGVSSGPGLVRTLQPFDMVASTAHTAFKYPGAMGASMGYPFTHAQWKELERQAMIYKYMVASAPVPPELLMPLTPRNLLQPHAPPHYSLGTGYGLRFSNNGDPEPGRCKRTDGKKWRCSREVAPDQKYCERHLHRGRPRSRKPVELHHPSNSKKTRLHPQPAPLPKTENPALFLHKDARNVDWLMIGDSSPVQSLDQHQWPSVMQSKMESAAEGSLNDPNPFLSKESMNLGSSIGYPSGQIPDYSKNDFFLNSDLLSLDKSQVENPKGFIDAWSNSVSPSNGNHCSVSSQEKLSLSPLTLSVGGNSSIEDKMGQVHLGFSLMDSDPNPTKSDSHTSWLESTSWASSTPGGPLAEVLRHGMNVTVSNPQSPTTGNDDHGSSLTTAVSSPSGVLQRTLASMSDSSGGSSPNLASSMARSEFTVKWFNPSDLA